MEKRGEDGRHSLPDLPDRGKPIKGGLHPKDDRGGPGLSDEAVGEGPVPKMWGRAGGRIPDGTPAVAAQTDKEPTVFRGPAATDRVQVLLSVDGGVSGIPGQRLQGKMTIRANLWSPFVHRPMWDTIVILEEGNLPQPRFSDCDMFVPWKTLNFRHSTTTLCVWGAEQNCNRLAE